jgi:hypothetical protein
LKPKKEAVLNAGRRVEAKSKIVGRRARQYLGERRRISFGSKFVRKCPFAILIRIE